MRSIQQSDKALGNDSDAERQELLQFAVGLAHDAGDIMLAYFDQANKGVEIKQNDTPVTAADKQINQLVISAVQGRYRDHGVLAEEESANEDRRHLWVCDPIDGTKGFIQGIPTSAFSLAFVVDGVPQVGVVYDPFQAKTYAATRGGQTTVNGRPLKVSPLAQLDGAQFAAVSSYRQLLDRRAFYDALQARKAIQVIVPGNVFRSALVAAGNIEAHIFPGRSAHDVAATKVIVEAAGGKVTDLYGNEQRYDGAIYGAVISNGHIHAELIQCLKDFGPENYIGY